MDTLDVCKQIKAAQDAVEQELLILENAGLTWYDQKNRDYSDWRVTPADTTCFLHGPKTYMASAHLKLQVEAAQLKLFHIISPVQDSLRSLGGYFDTDLPIAFERRHSGMVFFLMGFALRNCLDGKPETWVLPKVLDRIQPIQTGTGVFKMGHHTFRVDNPESVIKLYLILSAPKTDPKTRKKPKPMAEIKQVWDFDTTYAMQQEIIKNWD